VNVFFTHNNKFSFFICQKIITQRKQTSTFSESRVFSFQLLLSSSVDTYPFHTPKTIFSSIRTIIRVYYHYRKTYSCYFTMNLFNQIISNRVCLICAKRSCTIDLAMFGLDSSGVFVITKNI
jgi:hypothetical protein